MPRLIAAAFAALAFGACASTPTPVADAASGPAGDTASWRKLLQVEQRFAVFINEPGAPKTGDLVTFRLAYVYMPGQVMFDDREAGWQEYRAMTVDCAKNLVRAGPRTRYAPDGSVMMTDDSQTFDAINYGTAVEAAAIARCRGEFNGPAFSVKDGRNWLAAARKHIAENPPPPA
jgi:hypothetical protein